MENNDELTEQLDEQINNDCSQPIEVVPSVDLQAMSYPSSNITKVQL